jgi:hypothetical protein
LEDQRSLLRGSKREKETFDLDCRVAVFIMCEGNRFVRKEAAARRLTASVLTVIRVLEQVVCCKLFVLIAREIGLDDQVSIKAETTQLRLN